MNRVLARRFFLSVIFVVLIITPFVLAVNPIENIVKTLNVDFGQLYLSYPAFFDGVIYLILFISISTGVLGKLPMFKGSKAGPIVIGVVLAVSLCVFETTAKFHLITDIGPYVALMVVALFAFYIAKLAKNFGATWIFAVSIAILLAFTLINGTASISASVGKPTLFDALHQNEMVGSLVDIIYVFAIIGVVFGIIMIIMRLKSGKNKIDNASNILGNDKNVTDKLGGDIGDEEKKWAQDEQAIKPDEEQLKNAENAEENAAKEEERDAIVEEQTIDGIVKVTNQMSDAYNSIGQIIQNTSMTPDQKYDQLKQLYGYINKAIQWLKSADAQLLNLLTKDETDINNEKILDKQTTAKLNDIEKHVENLKGYDKIKEDLIAVDSKIAVRLKDQFDKLSNELHTIIEIKSNIDARQSAITKHIDDSLKLLKDNKQRVNDLTKLLTDPKNISNTPSIRGTGYTVLSGDALGRLIDTTKSIKKDEDERIQLTKNKKQSILERDNLLKNQENLDRQFLTDIHQVLVNAKNGIVADITDDIQGLQQFLANIALVNKNIEDVSNAYTDKKDEPQKYAAINQVILTYSNKFANKITQYTEDTNKILNDNLRIPLIEKEKEPKKYAVFIKLIHGRTNKFINSYTEKLNKVNSIRL